MNEYKYTSSRKSLVSWFSSSHAKIDVCLEDDVHTFNSIRLK